jgi:DNA-binding winged helix-turn-helix (wHTH) protein/dipeptidyl aminopeptidase/acylaminoacyl peptidase
MSQEREPLVLIRENPGETDDGRRLRFGVFELAPASGELRKAGVLVKLRHQPAKVLAHLASRPGRVVTREELQAAVWGGDTFVDFDQGLNYCIKEIRAALSDSAETPLYVETLPRRGYRFIAPVESFGEVAGSEVEPEAKVPALAAAGVSRRVLWTLVVGVGVVVAVACGVAWFLARRPAPPAADWQRVTFRRGALGAARFGPGTEIVFSAAWDGEPPALYAASPGSPDARALGTSPGARLAGVTESGDVVFLLRQTGGFPLLARAPLAGGPLKAILESVLDADVTPDGAELAVAHRVIGKGIQVEFPIGNVLAPLNSPSHLRISPDRSKVAFLEHPRTGDDRGLVLVLDRAGKPIAHSSYFASLEGLAWSPSGEEVWFTAARVGSSTALLALDLHGRERVLLPASGRLVLHDVARDGRVLLERATDRVGVRFSGASGIERDLTWFDATRVIALSPDGSLALLNETGDAGGAAYATYLRRTDGSPAVRLGSGVGTALSPDGRFALAVPLSPPDHIAVLPTGPGETRALRYEGIVQYEWAGYTPDGSRVVFVGGERGRNLRVFVGDPEGGRPRAITPEGLIIARDLVSPDGQTVVGPCRPLTFCLYPLDGGEPRPIPGHEGFVPVAWTPDGRALLVRTREARVPLELLRLDLATGNREPWKTLRPPDMAGLTGPGSVALSRDGRSLAYSFATRLSDLYLVPRL